MLELFSEQLQIASFTLNEVQLPPEVTGDTLAISGAEQGVSLVLSFQDVQDAQGVLAIRALFQAPTLTPLQALFTKLPAGFFKEIVVDGAGASVAVPGLATLHFASPSYGVVGIVTPSSGLVTEWIAPRVDGQVSPPSGIKGLFVELQTATSGCRIAPLTDGWSFDDLGWLMPKLGILGAFPDIIPTKGLGLKSFDLNLYPQAPSLSSLSLDVADIKNPTKPLWSAAGGKVELTDVNVTLALTYPASAELALAGSGSVQGNFKFGRPGNQFVLQAQIPFPLSGVWSLTAFPNLSLEEGLEDLATLLDSGASFSGVMPAGLSDVLDKVELTYLRIAVSAEPFNLVEFTFALGLRKPWPLIPNVLVLEKLNLHMTSDGKSGIYGSVVGDLELPNASEILVSFGRSTPNDQWRLDVISPAIALPSLTDLAQIQGDPKVDLGSLVKAGGLDQGGSGGLHFLITGLNFGLAFGPTKLMNLGLTLQLANASAPLSPQLDWELIPGLTLTEFSFGFQLDWGGTDTKNAFGTFVLNGLEFDIRFAEESKQGAKTDALIAEYYAQGDAGKVDVKHLIHSISPSIAEDVPEGLEIDLNDAILVYFNNAGTKKYLFAMDIAVEFPLSDLPLIGNSLPADAKAGIKNLKVVVASAALTADEVSFVNGLSPHPVLPLPAANTSGDAIPKGFSMVAELELGAASILMTSPPAKQQGTTTPPQLTAGAGDRAAGRCGVRFGDVDQRPEDLRAGGHPEGRLLVPGWWPVRAIEHVVGRGRPGDRSARYRHRLAHQEPLAEVHDSGPCGQLCRRAGFGDGRHARHARSDDRFHRRAQRSRARTDACSIGRLCRVRRPPVVLPVRRARCSFGRATRVLYHRRRGGHRLQPQADRARRVRSRRLPAGGMGDGQRNAADGPVQADRRSSGHCAHATRAERRGGAERGRLLVRRRDSLHQLRARRFIRAHHFVCGHRRGDRVARAVHFEGSARRR